MDRRPRTLVAGALCALVVFTSVGVLTGIGDGVATAAGASLSLLGQSPWVGPDQAFSARMAVSGAAARSPLGLEVTVYPFLTTRSAFDQTLTNPPTGRVLARSTPQAVSSLPSDPSGGFDVSVGVTTAPGESSPATGSPFSVDLDCPPGSCGGVYPVVFTLTSPTGTQPLDQLTTYLVYVAPPPDTQRLRMALVVPLGLPPDAPNRAGHLSGPTDRAVSALNAVSAGLAAHSDVPVTVVPDPASAQSMSTDPRALARRTLTLMAGVSTDSAHQVVCPSFTPVNVSALFTDGLGSELTDQLGRGNQVLAGVGVRTAGCGTTGGVWVAGTTVDAAAITGLTAAGYRDVVVPSSAVSGPTPYTTPTRLFTLSAARSGLTAVQTDPGLQAQLQAASGPTSVLAAYQLLSELALIYYEAPNASVPRGVAAVSPDVWAPNPAFVSDVLAGLDQNPILEPVTVNDLFAQVPIGGTVGNVTDPAVRHPATGTGASGTTALPAAQIRAMRQKLEGFASAVSPAGASTARSMQDMLLRSESDDLKAAQQVAGLAGTQALLGAQLGALTIRTDTIRLTSISANVPITVLHSSPYAVTGSLCLTSDKLLFPAGRCQAGASLVHFTNSFTFTIRARASGDFRVSVTFTSPDGRLVLASAQLSVRSMSTSAVAIALSVAAVIVLLVWWGRTLWRGRRAGWGAHARRSERARRRADRHRHGDDAEADDGTPPHPHDVPTPDPVA